MAVIPKSTFHLTDEGPVRAPEVHAGDDHHDPHADQLDTDRPSSEKQHQSDAKGCENDHVFPRRWWRRHRPNLATRPDRCRFYSGAPNIRTSPASAHWT